MYAELYPYLSCIAFVFLYFLSTRKINLKYIVLYIK